MRITLCCQHSKYNELLANIERHLNGGAFKITKIDYHGPMGKPYDKNVSVDVWFKLRDKSTCQCMDIASLNYTFGFLKKDPCSFFYVYI